MKCRRAGPQACCACRPALRYAAGLHEFHKFQTIAERVVGEEAPDAGERGILPDRHAVLLQSAAKRIGVVLSHEFRPLHIRTEKPPNDWRPAASPLIPS